MVTCNLLYGYLWCTMAICGLLWLSVLYYGHAAVLYYGYLYSTTAICSLLWLPVDYYGYTYNLPSVLPSLLYTATLLCVLGLHYNTLIASVVLRQHYLLSMLSLLSVLLA